MHSVARHLRFLALQPCCRGGLQAVERGLPPATHYSQEQGGKCNSSRRECNVQFLGSSFTTQKSKKKSSFVAAACSLCYRQYLSRKKTALRACICWRWCLRAAARLLAKFANHSALSYSNSIVSFNFFQQQLCPLQ